MKLMKMKPIKITFNSNKINKKEKMKKRKQNKEAKR